jgi:16S rRNA (guanine527-N7)-methyltransferase
MDKPMELLEKGLNEWGLGIGGLKLDRFMEYAQMLINWNHRFNLTAITDPAEIAVFHFLDCLSIFKACGLEDGSAVIDIGTGAGFPGIPIKIFAEETRLLLVDSVKKKTVFLKEAVGQLNLKGVEVLHIRAEELGHKEGYRESFDVAVSRAVAELRILAEYCVPFVKTGGKFIAYKGPAANDECRNASNALNILGCKEPEIINVKVPYSDKTHNLIISEKYKETPRNYPRQGGKPRKQPL